MHDSTRRSTWTAVALITLIALAGGACNDDDEGVSHGPPTITRIDPTCISTNGGTVNVSGFGFKTTVGAHLVDGVVDTFIVSSDTLLTMDISSVSSAGEKTITIANKYGPGMFEFLDVVQAPVVTSVDPEEGSQCGRYQVTITGQYFEGGWTTVTPDDQPFFTDWEVFEDDPSPGVDKIVGTVAPHDPGPATVTLKTFGADCGAEATFDFTYYQADCGDDIAGLETIEGGPQVVGIGDFDHDGDNDVAVAFHDAAKVTVFLGNGSGEFPDQYDVALGADDRPVALAVADLNGDDRDDIAIAVERIQRVDVLLQDLGGSLVLQSDLYDLGDTPVGIVAANLNVDAYIDLAVPTATGDVIYLAGTSSGVFSLADMAPTGLSSIAEGIAAGDPNASGVSDLYFPLPLSENVATLLNESTADTFLVTEHDRDVGNQVRAIAYHDVHPDHAGAEVMVTDKSETSDALTLLGEYSGGTPGYVESFDVGANAVMVAGGRFRPDGADGQVALFYGDLAKLFLAIFPNPPGFGKMYGEFMSGYPNSYATGDLDGDGYDDIAIGLTSGTRIDLYLSSISW